MKLNITSTIVAFIVLLSLVFLSFLLILPAKISDSSAPENQFSTERALVHLKEITKAPHYIGTEEHARVREYLIDQLELLGLETQVQEGFAHNPKWGVLAKPKNILARLSGTEPGKALLLLAHYDSAPHTGSYGASDAGSGVVAILESLRAYLSSGKTPKNDIIVLFSDAEEVGLLGAKLFVEKHPWANDVGLVINFEARGSGGPANMIVETNGGNSKMIQEFIKADPSHPVATSLMYSVYKMLPNDTDSTIFREVGDIDSFFFAFIDGHYDYHTANDTYENLSRKTLEHQGSYAMAMLDYFSEANLDSLKAEEDNVYFNFPFIKMATYPFGWIFPILIFAILLFIAVILYGISNQKLDRHEIMKGFMPFLSALLLSGLIGFFGWKILLKIYPNYNEILHGFTYNGNLYILAFVAFSLTVAFSFYGKFHRKERPANLAVAPLFIWIIINILLAFFLKGGTYFIIPVLFAIISLLVVVHFKNPNVWVLILLAIPAIFIFSPFIQYFPVGLGLGMVVISSVFTVLLFGLLVPILASFRLKNTFAIFFFMVGIGFLIGAHFQSKFSEKRPAPNSLVYINNIGDNQAYWATYDRKTDPWTENYLGKKPEEASKYIYDAPGSKYGTDFSFAAPAPLKNIPHPQIVLHYDQVRDGYRHFSFTVTSQRPVNRIALYADPDAKFKSFTANGKGFPQDISSGFVLENRRSNTILNYYVTDADPLHVSYSIPQDDQVILTLQEISFDLLENETFSIPERSSTMIPKPFVTTDAIINQQLIQFTQMPPLQTPENDEDDSN